MLVLAALGAPLPAVAHTAPPQRTAESAGVVAAVRPPLETSYILPLTASVKFTLHGQHCLAVAKGRIREDVISSSLYGGYETVPVDIVDLEGMYEYGTGPVVGSQSRSSRSTSATRHLWSGTQGSRTWSSASS